MAKSTVSYIDGTELEPRDVTVSITDPITLKALSNVPAEQLQDFIERALSIGVVALDAATKEAEAVRLRDIGTDIRDYMSTFKVDMAEEVEDVIKNYFDPKSGKFEKRIETLLKGEDGGEIGRLIENKLKGDDSPLLKALNKFLGPDSDFTKKLDPDNTGGVVNDMRSAIEKVVKSQVDAIIEEFSLNNEEGALSRLTTKLEQDSDTLGDEIKGIFDLNNESSQLSVFKRAIFNEVINIKDILSEFDKKVGERLAIEGVEKKTTIGGKIFEEAVTDFIVDRCSEGVITEAVGNISGATTRAKKGDVLITMGSDTVGAGRKIVVEIKNEKGKTYQSAIDELIEAKRNRKADVGVFVFSKQTAPKGMGNLKRNGKDIFVIWDNDSNDYDGYLEAAISLSKALIAQDQSHQNDNYDTAKTLENSIELLEQSIYDLNKISGSTKTIQNQVDSLNTVINSARRKVSTQIVSLNGLLDAFRAT